MLPFYGVDRPGLKLPPQHPRQPDICGMESMFPAIRAKDRLLYHPYDSFCAVLEFIRQAARTRT